MTSNSAGFLALSCIGFIASAPASAADPKVARPVAPTTEDTAQTRSQSDSQRREERTDVIVTGQQYQTQQETPKSTRPVLDTPQTVQIITGQTIEEQNLLTLRDVLSTVPGITFGAGEGGGGYGDSITLRGYSANTDITVDGVRDSAQYTRTDPFNLEQIEVVNGANSVYSGAGSVGGSINIVTKRPTARDRIAVTGGVGTDDYYRGTVDVNQRVSDMIAVRLNGMYHRNDVPGRDVENYKRWGVAPAVTIGVASPTRLTLQYVHQEDENIPQYGVPYYRNAFNNGAVAGVDRSDYFGYRNVDAQDSNVDQLTGIVTHDFTSKLSIRNLTRWQDVRQIAIVDPPQGTFCLTATSLTPSGGACTAAIAAQTIGTTATPAGTLTVPAGYYLPSGPRGNARDSRNQLMYNQLDLNAVFDTGGVEHTLVLGASAMWEKYGLSTGSLLRNANGTATFNYLPIMNIANPNDVIAGPAATTGLARVYGSNIYTGAYNYIESARQTGETTNYAVYLFDAMKFGDHFELNGGLRYEHNAGWYRADTVSTATATLGAVTTGTRFDNKDNLFSYRIGAVYKPVRSVSIYAAYGNSQTPSKTSVNGSCTAATCNVAPETAKTYEVGAKAEFFGERLLLTAAAFRNERDSYKVPSNDPTLPDQQLDGASRVDGIALGAVGKITPNLQVTASYTYLKPELIRSVSKFCLANPGPIAAVPPATAATNPCGNSSALRDPAAGHELQNTPKHSGSLFATYRLPFGLTIGYGFTYQGSFALNLPALATPLVAGSTALTPIYRSDDYLIHNAYLAYDVTREIKVQLNVKNLTDELYYTRIRNNGWATPGDARSAILTVSAIF